jgi:two-component system secretion response regulator SsrB
MKNVLPLKDEPRADEASVDLTARQRQILDLVSVGHTNREIASILKISVRTVEVHRFHLMRRLNVRNVAQLLGRSLQLGLLSPRLMRSRPDERGTVVQLPLASKLRKAVTAYVSDGIHKPKLRPV